MGELLLIGALVIAAGAYLLFYAYRQVKRSEANCQNCARRKNGCQECPYLRK